MADGVRRELAAIVALNDRRHPTLVAETAQRFDHVVRAQSQTWYQPNTFARVQINDAEHPERGPIGELIVDDVHRPALVGRARDQTRDTRRGAAAPLRPFALLRELFVLI